jgi:hypothetical protein
MSKKKIAGTFPLEYPQLSFETGWAKPTAAVELQKASYKRHPVVEADKQPNEVVKVLTYYISMCYGRMHR